MLDAPHKSAPLQTHVLLRQTVALPGCEPDVWALGQACQALWGPWVAQWSDPQGGLACCALGSAWAGVLPARGRFEAARETLSRLQEGIITLGPTPAVEAPVMVCAFAFEADACGRPSPFAALGGGYVVVPSCLLLRGNTASGSVGPTWAVLQLMCPSHDAAAQSRGLQTLRTWAHAVMALAARPQLPLPGGQPISWAQAPEQPDGAADAARWAFEGLVAQAQRALGSSLRKVVLARMEHARLRAQPDATAAAFRAGQGNTTAFGLALPGGAHFLGATPETLVRLAAGQLRSEALAGTARPGHDGPSDDRARAALLASVKDRQEHALVVRGMVQALEPWVERLEVHQHPQAQRLRHMWHLHTPLTGQVRPGTDVLALVAALHPTPALGGMPSGAAQQHLLQHEPWRRGLYAAPLGWLGLEGQGVFVAGIRSLWCDDAQVTLFAGAGIVADSVPHNEWQETSLKLTPAAQALRIHAT